MLEHRQGRSAALELDVTVRRVFIQSMVRAAAVLALLPMACVLGYAPQSYANSAAKDRELKLGVLTEPTSLDPHFHNLTPNDSALSHIYERLVQFDDKGQLKPGLAVSWERTNDLTWVFKLRPNVTWHDGGAFSADDVVASFERAASIVNSPSSFAAAITGKTVQKIDALTLEIATQQPDPLMLNQVARIMIVPKAKTRAAKTEDFNSGKAAIGTGPFRLLEFVSGKHLALVRNDAYWGDKPYWERLLISPLGDTVARVTALMQGEVDMIEDVPTSDITRLKAEQKFEIVQAVTQRVMYLHMDQFRETSPFVTAKDGNAIPNPFKDKRVRLALSKAINRDAIVARVMAGAAIPASQFLADGYPGTAPSLKPMAYDPDGAKKLLADAGYPQGFKLTLHGTIGRYTNDVRIAGTIAQMLQRIGIETTLVSLPPGEFFQRASSGDKGRPEFSLILAGRNTGTGEVSDSLFALVHSFDQATGAGAANRGRFSNADVDALIEAAKTTMDEKARAELLAQASVLAMAEGAIVPIHHPVKTWALRQGLSYVGRADEFTLGMGVTVK